MHLPILSKTKKLINRQPRNSGAEVRLRDRPVRRLHRAHRWPAHAQLPGPGLGRGRGQGQHHRGHGRRSDREKGPGRLDRPGRGPVRLLPARPDHERHGAVEGHAQAHRRRYRRGDEREHLPLRDLHAHPRGHQAGLWPASEGIAP